MLDEDKNYYARSLNSQKLWQVYDTKIQRVRQYLDAEIDFVRKRLRGIERVLEAGAGYGRILKKLAFCARSFLGIDISGESVRFGREYVKGFPNIRLEVMDAHDLDFDGEFDAALCLQNGLSAMKGEALNLVNGCVRALKKGGAAYFSTYSEKFWPHRLAWFEEQADKGLLGKIDRNKTGEGVIACEDGFRAVTFTKEDFAALGEASGHEYEISENDGSSLFLVITKTQPG